MLGYVIFGNIIDSDPKIYNWIALSEGLDHLYMNQNTKNISHTANKYDAEKIEILLWGCYSEKWLQREKVSTPITVRAKTKNRMFIHYFEWRVWAGHQEEILHSFIRL